jgi:hypothetical protein
MCAALSADLVNVGCFSGQRERVKMTEKVTEQELTKQERELMEEKEKHRVEKNVSKISTFTIDTKLSEIFMYLLCK